MNASMRRNLWIAGGLAFLAASGTASALTVFARGDKAVTVIQTGAAAAEPLLEPVAPLVVVNQGTALATTGSEGTATAVAIRSTAVVDVAPGRSVTVTNSGSASANTGGNSPAAGGTVSTGSATVTGNIATTEIRITPKP